MMAGAIRRFRYAREGIDAGEAALRGTIPLGAEVHHPSRRVVQFAGEAEGGHGAALDSAPGVVLVWSVQGIPVSAAGSPSLREAVRIINRDAASGKMYE